MTLPGQRIHARWVRGKGTDVEKHFDVVGVVVWAERHYQDEQ